MKENDISGEVVDICIQIHTLLGPGLLESAYEKILYSELQQRDLKVRRQVYLPVEWKGVEVSPGFRADLIVEDKVILEIKSLDALAQVHYKQVRTYLKLSGLKLGLLLNFGEILIKDGIHRIANNMTS